MADFKSRMVLRSSKGTPLIFLNPDLRFSSKRFRNSAKIPNVQHSQRSCDPSDSEINALRLGSAFSSRNQHSSLSMSNGTQHLLHLAIVAAVKHLQLVDSLGHSPKTKESLLTLPRPKEHFTVCK